MDLGIAGRKAIVCASSRGLGRACAKALAQGCEVVINGRDREQLAATAAELHQATGAKITPASADSSQHDCFFHRQQQKQMPCLPSRLSAMGCWGIVIAL